MRRTKVFDQRTPQEGGREDVLAERVHRDVEGALRVAEEGAREERLHRLLRLRGTERGLGGPRWRCSRGSRKSASSLIYFGPKYVALPAVSY